MCRVPCPGGRAGVALCSATELSFTWLGFSTAMASNVLFAARAIFSKKLMSGMNPINVYNYVSMFALLICIPPVFIVRLASLPPPFLPPLLPPFLPGFRSRRTCEAPASVCEQD